MTRHRRYVHIWSNVAQHTLGKVDIGISLYELEPWVAKRSLRDSSTFEQVRWPSPGKRGYRQLGIWHFSHDDDGPSQNLTEADCRSFTETARHLAYHVLADAMVFPDTY